MNQIPDYSISLLEIQQLRKKASETAKLGQWSEVCDLADEIIVKCRALRIYCLDQLESQHQMELPLMQQQKSP
jgi:hypothetical protein